MDPFLVWKVLILKTEQKEITDHHFINFIVVILMMSLKMDFQNSKEHLTNLKILFKK